MGRTAHSTEGGGLLAAPGSRWAAVLGAVLLLTGVVVGTGDEPRVRQLTDEREL